MTAAILSARAPRRANSRLDERESPLIDPSPAVLADLMIAALVQPGGGTLSLDPSGDCSTLVLRRGNTTVARLTAPADTAAAAIGRLARMAGLDPLTERGSVIETRTARLSVRTSRKETPSEILVTLGTTSLGLSAELRLLSLHGSPVAARPLAQMKRCTTCGAYQAPGRSRCEADGGALREIWDDAKPGGTIGAYRLGALLGEGATGEVFAAEHAFIERKVAIKVLRASVAKDAAFESRFQLEALATSRLRHPSIVEVTDYGVLASGSPFIVMERIAGESLDRRLEGSGALEPRAALAIARASAIALAAAHAGGVIHNDFKPSNVILLPSSSDEAPRLKIVDFGAASFAGAKAETDDGMLVGTSAYMAPERIDGESSDGRSDCYSAGVMLHRMIAGALPFDATEQLAMFLAHLTATPKPLTSPYGALPSRVARVVSRALEKKPSERYQTMGEMILDIDRALEALDNRGWRRWIP
jgi:tRNA A-37 threonylcarbamoyl transferase component Bud32